jgi:soluble lytic murein transglycosylase-like protein
VSRSRTTIAVWKALGACALCVGALYTLGATPHLSAKAPVMEAVEAAPAPAPVPDPRRAALANYLSDRYHVAPERARVFVDEAHAAAEAFGVDPLLVLAVMAVESSFDPAARSGAGATGLMQVVPRFHRDKLAAHGGEAALLDPRVNALVGTWILKDSLRQAGNLRAGLQRYAGWQEDDEHRYASRVIAEKERLRRVNNHALTEAQGESNAS